MANIDFPIGYFSKLFTRLLRLQGTIELLHPQNQKTMAVILEPVLATIMIMSRAMLQRHTPPWEQREDLSVDP